jgi:APA family basic amino acid/polyamine antiporter
LAQDGLLPEIFGRLDSKGNLKWGGVLSGIPMTLIATFVPFALLDDSISVGILVAFCMTNTSLILMRCEAPVDKPHWLPNSLALYHVLAFLMGISCHWVSEWGKLVRWTLILVSTLLALWIRRNCPSTGSFGGSILRRNNSNIEIPELTESGHKVFQTPFVPILPCLGISINYYLIGQLELNSLLLLVVYIGLITLLYWGCCLKIPFKGWKRSNCGGVAEEDYLDRDMVLLREFSLPKR